MHRAEHNSEHDCGGPETHTGSQRGLHVTAERKFLEDTNQDEPDAVKDSVLDCFSASDGESAERKAMEYCYESQQQGQHDEAERHTLPETFAECVGKGQAIIGERPLLNFGHDQC